MTEQTSDSPQQNETDTNPGTTEHDLPPLARQIGEYVRAAFGGLVIETDEPEDALVELYRMCDVLGWQLASWTLAGGLVDGQHAGDPAGALDALDEADGQVPLLLAMRGLHRFLGSPELISRLERRLHEGKTQRTCVVLLVPAGGVDLPPELRPLTVTLRHERPGREELDTLLRSVASEPNECPQDAGHLVDAAAGLTRGEAESAAALSLVRHGQLSASPLWQLKSETVRSGGLMTIWRAEDDVAGEHPQGFGSLRGLDALKNFAFRSLTSDVGDARGLLLLSPPGCGKSQFAKALSAETGRPLVQLDVGRLLGSLVGESERNLRTALGQIEAMGRTICLLDEVEKCLASGNRDSGVGQRLLGTLLTWMQERAAQSGAYIVMTANDARKLPPELTRAERLDATFFVDLPDAGTRSDIWSLYLDRYGHDGATERPADDGWTGAEIRSCCRIARMLGITPNEAARYVVPVSRTSREKIDRLRRWASGRCLDAHAGGPYRASTTSKTSAKRRSVSKRTEPSDN